MATLVARRCRLLPMLRKLTSSSSYSKCISNFMLNRSIHMRMKESSTVNSEVKKLCEPVIQLPTVSLCTSQTVFIECWNCDTRLPPSTSFCDNCNSLQPLDYKLNHYEVLGIEMAFNIDTKILAKNFKKLQVQYHPDKYALKTQKEQQLAVEHSSAINKAYRCLHHPVERALYLLDLAGQPLHEGQLDIDPEFLMEIMEVNEELAEANERETIQAIGRHNQEILDGLLREADIAFSANNIEAARKIVARIKYYNNIYEKVRHFEREHGIVD